MSRLKENDRKDRYFNRELSWLQFNKRVLEEASNPLNPLLERLKFLAIFESNMDEFYMVRVSGLIEQFESGVLESSPDGLTPNEQLQIIANTALPQRKQAHQIFQERLRPQLEEKGIRIERYSELSERRRRLLDQYFTHEVFPLCTPLLLNPNQSVPFISNRSLNLVVELSDGSPEHKLARVKIPIGAVRRAVALAGHKHEFVMLEDLIANNLEALFPGVEVLGAYVFRVIRDADIEIKELEAADLMASIEETLRLRRFGAPVLLECAANTPDHIRQELMSMLELDEEDVFQLEGLIGLSVFWEIGKIDRPDLRFPPHVPLLAEPLSSSHALFETVSQADVLVHHPYDSFRSVEEYVASAAKDPAVFGIKQTLYRVGSESPLVESLLDAAEKGKQVAAMVELKARFDESNNLVWARALERAGVHVTYGFSEMKTHCKLCLVVRKESTGMKTYVHIGTGNYNPTTARIYTDLGLFTCNEEITQDVSELFNYLTGYSKQTKFRKLLVAPLNLREGILEKIKHETSLHRKHGNGRIIWKLNHLVDPEVIDALYHASSCGVKVELYVRGVCCLRPNLPGLSDNIRVVSIVGRFLEHSRIYLFANAGKPDILIGSADAMRRNLDRRIEVLCPVESPRLIAFIRDRILDPYRKDNVRAWDLQADGSYVRKACKPGERAFDVQNHFMANPATKELFASS